MKNVRLCGRFFMCVVSWGVCPKPRHKGLFVKSPLESQKLRKNKLVCVWGKFLRIFKGLFTKSLLKQGPSRQFQLLTKNKKHGVAVFFVCIECWGFCPKLRHKKLFVKSFLELQKLCQNKLMCLMVSSFAHFSLKEKWVMGRFLYILT